MANSTVEMYNGDQHLASDFSFAVRVRVGYDATIDRSLGRCSGMVYKTTVLTSAHCFKHFFAGQSPPYTVNMANANTDVSIGGGTWVRVDDIQIHDLYRRIADQVDPSTPDLAALRLPSELPGLSAASKEWCVDTKEPQKCQKFRIAAYGPQEPGASSHADTVTTGEFVATDLFPPRPYWWLKGTTSQSEGSPIPQVVKGDSGSPVFREPGLVPVPGFGRRYRVKGINQGAYLTGERKGEAKVLAFSEVQGGQWWRDYASAIPTCIR